MDDRSEIEKAIAHRMRGFRIFTLTMILVLMAIYFYVYYYHPIFINMTYGIFSIFIGLWTGIIFTESIRENITKRYKERGYAS